MLSNKILEEDDKKTKVKKVLNKLRKTHKYRYDLLFLYEKIIFELIDFNKIDFSCKHNSNDSDICNCFHEYWFLNNKNIMMDVWHEYGSFKNVTIQEDYLT